MGPAITCQHHFLPGAWPPMVSQKGERVPASSRAHRMLIKQLHHCFPLLPLVLHRKITRREAIFVLGLQLSSRFQQKANTVSVTTPSSKDERSGATLQKRRERQRKKLEMRYKKGKGKTKRQVYFFCFFLTGMTRTHTHTQRGTKKKGGRRVIL